VSSLFSEKFSYPLSAVSVINDTTTDPAVGKGFETKYLQYDTELWEFLARKMLIASSRPLNI
jgi:hypothetical protein